MASPLLKKPKQPTPRFTWDGISNIFNWILFKIQFESNLTLIPANAYKILSAKNRLEPGIDYEYKRTLQGHRN
jgi:hypothetical protein